MAPLPLNSVIPDRAAAGGTEPGPAQRRAGRRFGVEAAGRFRIGRACARPSGMTTVVVGTVRTYP